MLRALEKILTDELTHMGFTLWGIEVDYRSHVKRILVYIENSSHISIKDCQSVHNFVSIVIKIKKIVKDPYIIEVSSPGLNKRIFTSIQLKNFLGKNIRIKFHKAKILVGELLSVESKFFIILEPTSNARIKIHMDDSIRINFQDNL